MTDNPPKISFIPKSSLVREDSFMESKRPRSIMEFLAIIAVILTVSAYAGFYFYGNSLDEQTKKITADIAQAQSVFNNSPDIENAKIFRDRAETARQLLNAHMAVSPIFEFLTQSTLQSILYKNFSFKNDAGVWVLELTGEAQNYASLAYQADVLKSESKELSGFSVENVTLTKFGTVTFTLREIFTPAYLSYLAEKDRGSKAMSATTTAPLAPQNFMQSGTTTSPFKDVPQVTTGTSTASVGAQAEPPLPTSITIPTSVSETSSWWSWFKFW